MFPVFRDTGRYRKRGAGAAVCRVPRGTIFLCRSEDGRQRIEQDTEHGGDQDQEDRGDFLSEEFFIPEGNRRDEYEDDAVEERDGGGVAEL